MESPVGESSWVEYFDHHFREANDLETRINILERFRRAVSTEPGSVKVWLAYCEYFWSLYANCQPDGPACWPLHERETCREVFTLDAALGLWKEGYEAIEYRLSDSHELWNRWIAVELELLARTGSNVGVIRVSALMRNRLLVPHATWDKTAQMFSSFLSEYNPQGYEEEMQNMTRNAANAKRLYDLRDRWEMKLAAAAKSHNFEAAQRDIMEGYLAWEISGIKDKKDGYVNIRICLGLFARALTGLFVSDEATWLNFLVLISSMHTDIRNGSCKTPEIKDHLPNMLDVHQCAVRRVPWSGTIWARYILSAEEAGLSFTDIERIKHAATSSEQLDRDGMAAVLDMYSAWCGYLKRQAMDPNSTEEAVDVAEVGLPAACEDVNHWGKRKYGDAFQGDPNYRLERILIQLLTEKNDVNHARSIWEQLSRTSIHASSYDFWLNWYLWEMVVYSSIKGKTRSPPPASTTSAAQTPSQATRVFLKALGVTTLDWPERIMDVYLQHCNDYEPRSVIRQAMDMVFKTRKKVAKRREREAAQAAKAQSQMQPPAEEPAAMQEASVLDAAQRQTGANDQDDGPGGKRKRDPTPEDASWHKRAKNGAQGNDAAPKRDREHTSVYVSNLPDSITLTKIKHFFRDYGHINNVNLQNSEGSPPLALVEFRTANDAETALMRDGKKIDDRIVSVTPAIDCTLFVANYPPDADEDFLSKLFRGHGYLHSIRFPSLKFSTKRRFCYVSFREPTAAAAAIEALDGKKFDGGKYKLQVKLSDPSVKQQRQGAMAEQRELHVTNLHHDAKDKYVEDIFAKVGKVVSARILRDKTGYSTGAGFVVMETKEDAQKAIELLDKIAIRGRLLRVELSRYIHRPARVGDASQSKSPGESGAARRPDAISAGEGSLPATTLVGNSLMPPPPTVRRPVLGGGGRGRGRGGRGGFIAAKRTGPVVADDLGHNSATFSSVDGKNNDDFKKMFLASGSGEGNGSIEGCG